MQSFFNLERLTLENTSYRKVISTTAYNQIVLMSLEKGEEIEKETHPYVSQFIRIEEGIAKVTLNGESKILRAGDAVNIPSNTEHHLENYANSALKLYTIYSPPQHAQDLEQMFP